MKSNIEWKIWGKTDPLWAVAAWKDRHKTGTNPWTDEDFYALGDSDWADFIRQWTQYGLSLDEVIEIGCGAGRITKAMRRSFRTVHALDVSPDMIEYASARIMDPNVTFVVVDGTHIPVPDKSVTAVFSTHVFQHLDTTQDGAAYFRECSRVLKDGGTCMIHLPIFAWPWGAGKWTRRIFAITKKLEGIRAEMRRRAMQNDGPGMMRMNSYAMSYLYSLLPALGFVDIEIRVFSTRSNGEPHSFVFARKDGS